MAADKTATLQQTRADEPALAVRAISKRFPGVQALDAVDLDVHTGEVHAVCGENGAGKSTLMKVIAGNHQPDSGDLFRQGQPIELTSPLQAKHHGILLIHQEISLVPELTVAENIFLGNLPRARFGTLDKKRLIADAERAIERAGFALNATDIAGSLSVAHQQMVEIARAVALRSSIVIFDEPTASLTESEADALFTTIRRLRDGGVAILYISHKLPEILAISDRISVLRDGRLRGTLQTREADENAITSLMIGRHIEHAEDFALPEPGDEVLGVTNLTVKGHVDDIHLSIRAGEIVGLYGLVGAGRSQIAEALFGLRSATGTICWRGRPVTIQSPQDAMRLSIGLVPEDRKMHGLVLDMGGAANITLAALRRIRRAGLIDKTREHALFDQYRETLQIAVGGPDVPVGTLSGGNQQKVVLGKWLATQPQLLILDEPTRGVDVGAKAEIHRLISEMAREGMAILLISSEMPEIMLLSERVITMHEGSVTGTFGRADISEQALVDGITANLTD